MILPNKQSNKKAYPKIALQKEWYFLDQAETVKNHRWIIHLILHKNVIEQISYTENDGGIQCIIEWMDHCTRLALIAYFNEIQWNYRARALLFAKTKRKKQFRPNFAMKMCD